MIRKWCRTIVAVLLLACCSVKEERSGCPCLLNLDLDEVIAEGRFSEAVATVGPSSERPVGQETIEVEPYRGVGYEITVPRRSMMTSVVCGNAPSSVIGSCVDAGTSPVMAFAEKVNLDSETERAQVLVRLHKQYCRMTLVLEGYSAGADFPFVIDLKAQTRSIDLYGLEPCGDPLEETLPENLVINIPRQNPSAPLSLVLKDLTGEVQYEMDLGAKLAAAGYDWTDEDLSDVSVTLDYSHLQCSVTVLDWEDDSQYRQIDI